MKCVFCEDSDLYPREIVRNNLAWAFPTNIPIVPGHILIVPIRCVATFEELTDDERDAIFALQKKLKNALKKSFKANGFNHAWNEGDVAGQSIPHFHLHLVPRYTGDTGITEYEPRKFLYRPGSRKKIPQEELESVAELIKDNL